VQQGCSGLSIHGSDHIIIHPRNTSVICNDTYGITVCPANTSLMFNERDNHTMYVNGNVESESRSYDNDRAIELDRFMSDDGSTQYNIQDVDGNYYIDKYNPTYMYVRTHSGSAPSAGVMHDVSAFYWSGDDKRYAEIAGGQMLIEKTTDPEKFKITPANVGTGAFSLDVQHSGDHELLHVYAPVRFTKYPATSLTGSATEYVKHGNQRV